MVLISERFPRREEGEGPQIPYLRSFDLSLSGFDKNDSNR